MISDLALQWGAIRFIQVQLKLFLIWVSAMIWECAGQFSRFGSVWDTDYPDGVTKPNDNSMRQTLGVVCYGTLL